MLTWRQRPTGRTRPTRGDCVATQPRVRSLPHGAIHDAIDSIAHRDVQQRACVDARLRDPPRRQRRKPRSGLNVSTVRCDEVPLVHGCTGVLAHSCWHHGISCSTQCTATRTAHWLILMSVTLAVQDSSFGLDRLCRSDGVRLWQAGPPLLGLVTESLGYGTTMLAHAPAPLTLDRLIETHSDRYRIGSGGHYGHGQGCQCIGVPARQVYHQRNLPNGDSATAARVLLDHLWALCRATDGLHVGREFVGPSCR